MKRSHAIAVFIVFLVCVTCLVSGTLLWIDFQKYLDDPLEIANDRTDFYIERGQSLIAVSDALWAAGVITRPSYWQLEARRRGLSNRIQAGEYLIESNLTPRTLLDKFVAGDVRQHSVTFIEGMRFSDLREALRAHPKITQTVSEDFDDQSLLMLDEIARSPEGLFFPDTYFFTRGTTDIQILMRARAKMQALLEVEWGDRDPDLPYNTPYEALILASIVEKETAVPNERERVAGVFIRRLKRGMRLQTDPSVIYGIGPEFDGNLKRSDLQNDNPYNTYTRHGLPPTPIAMPGRAALHAAMHPDESEYLYFVSKGDGGHHFSTTLNEHNEAVRKYQR